MLVLAYKDLIKLQLIYTFGMFLAFLYGSQNTAKQEIMKNYLRKNKNRHWLSLLNLSLIITVFCCTTAIAVETGNNSYLAPQTIQQTPAATVEESGYANLTANDRAIVDPAARNAINYLGECGLANAPDICNILAMAYLGETTQHQAARRLIEIGAGRMDAGYAYACVRQISGPVAMAGSRRKRKKKRKKGGQSAPADQTPAVNTKQIINLLLNKALNDILIPHTDLEKRAAEIFAPDNRRRFADLCERLRDHGAERLGFDEPVVNQLIDLVEQLRVPGKDSRKLLQRRTGFKNRALALLALDHALDPDLFHPLEPKSYYLANEGRLIPLFWVHGDAKNEQHKKEQIEEHTEMIREEIRRRGLTKVWVHEEHTIAFSTHHHLLPSIAQWQKAVDFLLRDRRQKEKIFTESFFNRNRGNDTCDVLREIAHALAEGFIPKSLTREEMTTVLATDKIGGVDAPAWVINHFKNYLSIPELAGIAWETASWSELDYLNIFLFDYLKRTRFKQAHRSSFPSALDLER